MTMKNLLTAAAALALIGGSAHAGEGAKKTKPADSAQMHGQMHDQTHDQMHDQMHGQTKDEAGKATTPPGADASATTAMPDTSVNPPANDTAAMPPASPYASAEGVPASATVSANATTNGPVADTPENRAKYKPLSREVFVGAKAGIRTVVDEFAVYFIRNESKAVFLHDACHHIHFFFRVDDTGRVARVRQKDGTGLGRYILLDSRCIRQAVAIFCMSRYRFYVCAGDLGKRIVVRIERFKDQDLIPRIAESESCELQSLTAAIGDVDVLRFVVHSPCFIVLLYLSNQLRIPLRRTISDHFFVKAADGIHKLRRRLDIRLSDIQMIDFLPCLLCFESIGAQSADRGCGQT